MSNDRTNPVARLRAMLLVLRDRLPSLRRAPAPLGSRGERIAEKFLRKSRYRVLERNARTRIGEADLVCEAPDGRTIVIVEVKTRITAPGTAASSSRPAPPPEAAVGAHKTRKLLLVADDLVRRRGWANRPLRIDVVAIEVTDSMTPTIRHHIGAVRMATLRSR
ncbi:MAG TPA: YraN family protein [Phycisphaerales bacterium]|nr:YraN family protein [Phycisphaerales bacterium]